MGCIDIRNYCSVEAGDDMWKCMQLKIYVAGVHLYEAIFNKRIVKIITTLFRSD